MEVCALQVLLCCINYSCLCCLICLDHIALFSINFTLYEWTVELNVAAPRSGLAAKHFIDVGGK